MLVPAPPGHLDQNTSTSSTHLGKALAARSILKQPKRPMPVSQSVSSTAVSSPKVGFATNLTSVAPAPIPIADPGHGHRKRSSGSDLLAAASSPMKRSISTPTMASVSMISEDQLAEYERQRQGQIMMTSYISSAIRQKKDGNPIPFEELIAQLTVTKPAPLTPAKQLQWVQALSQCISLVDKSCTALIDAMLQIDWTIQEDTFVQHYIAFLGNVVSAHAFYVVPVQDMLVKKLTTRYKSAAEHASTIFKDRQHERVHQALKYILDLIPTGPTSLFPLLASEFPHKRESINGHITYAKNILKVLEYAPVLRTQVLGVIIDRIIQIDVEIQVELEELEDSDTEVVYDFDLDDGEEEESDDDSDSDEDSDSGADSDEAHVAVLNIKAMTHKLDGMLFLVFTYLQGYVLDCQNVALSDPQAQPPVEIQEMFSVLLNIFMKTILHTFKSRHTQFLLFYYISPSAFFSDYFLGTLGQQILDNSQPQVLRIAAAAYMSSFVARAKYLDVRQVGMVVSMLGGFALDIVEQVDTGSNVVPDAERYAVFYAVVQALMYIFCFRWRVLVLGESKAESNKDDFDSAGMIVGSMDGASGSSRGSAPTRKWHSGLDSLQRILTSRLNPLKMCSDNVVKQFARLSHSLNFMYIYPILEQNKKTFIPRSYGSSAMNNGVDNGGVSSSGQQNGGALPHELDTFFPFDPYRLRQSAPFMKGIYQEWESEEDEEDEDEDEEDYDEYGEDEDGEEMHEDDEELSHLGRHNAQQQDDDDDLEMNKSIMAMSISPSPAHFLVQGMTVTQRRG
ncbi:hypothetical protein BGZ68_006873 [Mortierella alpina]|nr:hypothetical protein BGZ68_006873 [Mortierella alpina]